MHNFNENLCGSEFVIKNCEKNVFEQQKTQNERLESILKECKKYED